MSYIRYEQEYTHCEDMDTMSRIRVVRFYVDFIEAKCLKNGCKDQAKSDRSADHVLTDVGQSF